MSSKHDRFIDELFKHTRTREDFSHVAVQTHQYAPSTLQIHRHFGSLHRAVYSITAWPIRPPDQPIVPVIYFNVYATDLPDSNDRNGASSGGLESLIVDLDAVVEALVPEINRNQARAAISQGEHPVSGLPAFFLHPCRTEDWLSMITSEMENSTQLYTLWFDSFGPFVGL